MVVLPKADGLKRPNGAATVGAPEPAATLPLLGSTAATGSLAVLGAVCWAAGAAVALAADAVVVVAVFAEVRFAVDGPTVWD